ncbi:hypothetical protein K438DRAFT_1752466 [Mycena galopus ATCC 62051]|nr:hypothetical protein K438DRAFT_1752466 [Mycena galopus ATCC 62051]
MIAAGVCGAVDIGKLESIARVEGLDAAGTGGRGESRGPGVWGRAIGERTGCERCLERRDVEGRALVESIESRDLDRRARLSARARRSSSTGEMSQVCSCFCCGRREQADQSYCGAEQILTNETQTGERGSAPGHGEIPERGSPGGGAGGGLKERKKVADVLWRESVSWWW